MISLEDDMLHFQFDDVHAGAKCALRFIRTARIPDDGKNYPLPAGLGTFPIRHVDDCTSDIGSEIRKRGGVVLPMHASEAMWISFGGRSEGQYPFALKIAAGKINAITGTPWSAELSADPQDYLVIPAQPWLDGFCIEKGIIRQFVAERLGAGYSVEEQLTGKADFGGLQIVAYPMKREFYEAMLLRQRREAVQRILDQWARRLERNDRSVDAVRKELESAWRVLAEGNVPDPEELERRLSPWSGEMLSDESDLQLSWHQTKLAASACLRIPSAEMAFMASSPMRMKVQGLAAGGRMKQEIYSDPHGIDAWDQSMSSRCFVTLLDAADWLAATGEAVPTAPLSVTDYEEMGLPWFDYYAPAAPAVDGSEALSKVKSWATVKADKGEAPQDNAATGSLDPIHIGPARRTTNVVREAEI